jgi:hypothetical protein
MGTNYHHQRQTSEATMLTNNVERVQEGEILLPQQAAHTGREAYSADELAARFGLSVKVLADLRRRGGGPTFYRISRNVYRYPINELHTWLKARKHKVMPKNVAA